MYVFTLQAELLLHPLSCSPFWISAVLNELQHSDASTASLGNVPAILMATSSDAELVSAILGHCAGMYGQWLVGAVCGFVVYTASPLTADELSRLLVLGSSHAGLSFQAIGAEATAQGQEALGVPSFKAEALTPLLQRLAAIFSWSDRSGREPS